MLSQSLSDLVYEEILQTPLTLVHVKAHASDSLILNSMSNLMAKTNWTGCVQEIIFSKFCLVLTKTFSYADCLPLCQEGTIAIPVLVEKYLDMKNEAPHFFFDIYLQTPDPSGLVKAVL